MTEKGERAVPRQIPRAQMLAFIALGGDEAVQPERVAFREYRHVEASGDEWHCIDLDLSDEAAFRHWMRVFDMDESRIMSHPWTDPEGDVWTSIRLQHSWRGFTVCLHALVPPPVGELDDTTRAGLQQLVDEAAGRWAGEVPGEVYERDDEPVPVVDPSTVVGWPVGGGR